MPRTEKPPLVRKAARHANRSGLMLLLAIPVAFIVGGCIVVFFLFVRPKTGPPVVVASPACTESPPSVTTASEKPEPPVVALEVASARREAPAPPRHRANSRAVAAVPEKLEPGEPAAEAAFEPLGAPRH
ncbi:hypothetical protein LVJ94_30960 [Pendulispora rubella]|uniref:Uncharacterized protein n=1 Tax=Pendulispora rubella TaxID=2741070 RepID=A0ABZ2KRM0_9BACT